MFAENHGCLPPPLARGKDRRVGLHVLRAYFALCFWVLLACSVVSP